MFTNFAIGTAMLLASTTAGAQQPDLNMNDVHKFILRFNEKMAQQQIVPDEETKTRALKCAYQLNNNSMVGSTMDFSAGIPCDEPEPAMPPSPFKNPPEDLTDRTWADAPARVQVEIVDPRKFNEVDAMTSVHMDSVCKRHGLRKVVTDNGKSWRCGK